MIVRAADTPPEVKAQMYQEYDDLVLEKQYALKPPDYEEASRLAASEMAARYKLAYYESEGGPFLKVSP